MIHIIDYGMGNLRSVQKAFERVGVSAKICTTPQEIADAGHLVLPGVGAFRDAIAALQNHHFVDPVCSHINSGKPFLGICLGLQLLFDVSYEDGEYAGLGILPGKVVRFPSRPELKIPHMGWNAMTCRRETPLTAGIPNKSHFYFVHSYYVVPDDESVISGTSEHGMPFTAMIARGNMFATQFHPEKSQAIGLTLLQNFASLPG